jgi:hypothetical protein
VEQLAKPVRKSGPSQSVHEGFGGGATIERTYLTRQKESVAVDKDELDDLLSLDLISTFFMNAGSFFIAGSAWLGIEKYLDRIPNQPLPPVYWFCVAAFILGLFLIGAGFFHFRLRRGKLKRIFSQTYVVGTSSARVPYTKSA